MLKTPHDAWVFVGDGRDNEDLTKHSIGEIEKHRAAALES
jgi:hypothetical protein